jgi:predicted nucleic acid-binding protein
VEITLRVSECRDPKDDKFLELAINGEATVIISGDKDLLVLNPFRTIPILSPREFLGVDRLDKGVKMGVHKPASRDELHER